MAKQKQRRTSKKAGKAVSKVLKSKKSSKDAKTASGSALSQRAPKDKIKKKAKKNENKKSDYGIIAKQKKSGSKSIEIYKHKTKKRKNNPQVGAVTAKST